MSLPYFIKSCNQIKQIPQFPFKSIILAGRSNVGKSSLINSLARSKIAKTSKSPGCTKSLNFFNFHNKFILIDMPGYGYAKVSLEQRNEWNDFIYQYLSNYEIGLCIVLIDSKVGFKITDFEMINLLKDIGIRFIIVFTKLDKVYKHKVPEHILKASKETLGFEYSYISTSTREKIGLKEVYAAMMAA